ncbi:MAG: nucleotide sugar dehydrogenase [Acidimicrobiales bacterium]
MGQGYVGLPLATRAVERGFDVVGYDVDPMRVFLAQMGEAYIADVTNEQLAGALATGRFMPTNTSGNLADFDYAVIAVPTPLREGQPDLTQLVRAVRTLAAHVRPGSTVIVESTIHPGTTDEVLTPILEEGSGLKAGIDFALGYSPERVDPGDPDHSIATIPKIVSGIDDESRDAVDSFYRRLVDRTVPVSSMRVAELAKLMENTFRHVNIALVNELTMLAHDLDVDIWDAVDAAATKPFGYMGFRPGPGVGGDRRATDPTHMSWNFRRPVGRPVRFVELADDINSHMPDYVVGRLAASLNERGEAVRGRRVLLLGLSYKPNTGDTRDSPSLRIASQLATAGAEVRIADPHVRYDDFPIGFESVPASAEEVAAADVIVLVVDHDGFDYELVQNRGRFVLDCRHRLAPAPNVEFL